VSEAATTVVLAEAEVIADRREAAKAEAQAHLSQLQGVAAVWTSAGPGKPGPLQLSPRLRSIIGAAQEPLRHDPRWHALMKALREDPEAVFSPGDAAA
jgi:hypothetical protein